MSLFHDNVLLGASGSGSGPLYVDDVFSTALYTGNNSSQTITNGINLSGEGGLVWVKSRTTGTYNHIAMDTERGATSSLKINSSASSETISTRVSAFTSTGFSVGSNANVNASSNDYVSWSFRKAPGFFDVVTYTGNGSNRTIAHNLGSVPGFIAVKAIDDSRHWWCFHRSIGNTKAIPLSLNQAPTNAAAYWNNTDPTDTVFTVGTDADVNQNNTNYIAYLWAHDDQSFGTDEDEAIIKCGQYTGNGATDGPEIDLGFEPQWVMIKARDEGGNFRNWAIFDNMRGVFTTHEDKILSANLTTQEDSGQNSASTNFIDFTPTGFKLSDSGMNVTDNNGNRYIYIAIRRPHKPPESGTDVFHMSTAAENTNFDVGFVTDLTWVKSRNSSGDWYVGTRSTGRKYLAFQIDEPERTAYWRWDTPINQNRNPVVSNTPLTFSFKRAPGFMDVVTYSGTGSNQNITHNLTVAPEMIWVKRRNGNDYWRIYHSAQGNFRYHDGFKKSEKFDVDSSNAYWNSTSPTATQFTVGTEGAVNGSANTFVAILWATLPGVSKVGSYNGTGSALDIDCGFTNGARLVIIKRANTVTNGSDNVDPSHWFVFNSTRGIVSGNDPFLLLNEQTQEFTNEDGIDPLNSGFTVVGGGKGLNVSGGQYVFFAIA